MYQIERCILRPAIKSIKYLKSLNYKVVVVSNQSGVARGYFKISEVYKLHQFLQKLLKKKQTKIDKIVFCPFHKDGIIKKYKKNSILRKPNKGMFDIINKKLDLRNIDLRIQLYIKSCAKVNVSNQCGTNHIVARYSECYESQRQYPIEHNFIDNIKYI